MTRTVAYTAKNAEAANKIAATVGLKGIKDRALFNGRTVSRESELTFEYSASNKDQAAFERIVDRINAQTTDAAPVVVASADAATEKQIAFLSRLIADDPGAATTIGASVDGRTVRPGLTKAQASRLIDLMKDGDF